MANVCNLKLLTAQVRLDNGDLSERKAFVEVDGDYYDLTAIKRQPKTPVEYLHDIRPRGFYPSPKF